jgi:hypothetical protein
MHSLEAEVDYQRFELYDRLSDDRKDWNGLGTFSKSGMASQSESLIASFDLEVKNRCDMIRSNAENIAANLQSALELTLMAIPECVRKMPLKILMEKFDGDIQRAVLEGGGIGGQHNKKPSTPKTRRDAQTPLSRITPVKPRAIVKQGPQTPNVGKDIFGTPVSKKKISARATPTKKP